MTHLMLMKAMGIQPKRAEMYTQIYHFVRIVAIFTVLYKFKPFTPHFIFIFLTPPAAICNH